MSINMTISPEATNSRPSPNTAQNVIRMDLKRMSPIGKPPSENSNAVEKQTLTASMSNETMNGQSARGDQMVLAKKTLKGPMGSSMWNASSMMDPMISKLFIICVIRSMRRPIMNPLGMYERDGRP